MVYVAAVKLKSYFRIYGGYTTTTTTTTTTDTDESLHSLPRPR